MPSIKVKRIYEKPSQEDGIRILIDRLWPRGVSKVDAKLDYWLQELAPSNELRKWFNHDSNKFENFKEKYIKELESGSQSEAFRELNEIVSNSNQCVTLLFASKDKQNNNAQVIKQLIQ